MGENNILKSIKKMLGLDNEDNSFDIDIIININTVFNFLVQLGVDSFYRVYLHTGNEKWTDYLDDDNLYRLIETYTYLKVKDYFDPPTSGVLREAMERQIKELEWRITLMKSEFALHAVPEDPDAPDVASSEWYNIIKFIKDNPDAAFKKGMATAPLSAHDVEYFKNNALVYAFTANSDVWTLIDDDGDTFMFICTEGEHKDRDFNMHYQVDESRKAAWVKEFISTPDYELAQKLFNLPVGGTL